jgi:hypothetical protein
MKVNAGYILEWLEGRDVQIGWSDDEPQVRVVHEIRGSRNDREWHEVGHGETVRAALEAAVLADTTFCNTH